MPINAVLAAGMAKMKIGADQQPDSSLDMPDEEVNEALDTLRYENDDSVEGETPTVDMVESPADNREDMNPADLRKKLDRLEHGLVQKRKDVNDRLKNKRETLRKQIYKEKRVLNQGNFDPALSILGQMKLMKGADRGDLDPALFCALLEFVPFYNGGDEIIDKTKREKWMNDHGTDYKHAWDLLIASDKLKPQTKIALDIQSMPRQFLSTLAFYTKITKETVKEKRSGASWIKKNLNGWFQGVKDEPETSDVQGRGITHKIMQRQTEWRANGGPTQDMVDNLASLIQQKYEAWPRTD